MGNVGNLGGSVQRAVAFHVLVEMLNHSISYALSSWLLCGVGVVVVWGDGSFLQIFLCSTLVTDLVETEVLKE